MRIMLAQINPTIGDFRHNTNIIIEHINRAVQENVDVVILPELATIGYPPRDLLYLEDVWENNYKSIVRILTHIHGLDRQITAIVGGLDRQVLSNGQVANYNAAWILDSHFGKRVVHKRLLPCYDVFDETRYFRSSVDEPYSPIPIKCRDSVSFIECDVIICEDMWNFDGRMDKSLAHRSWMSPGSYGVDPISYLRGSGPLFIINASPFWENKIQTTSVLLHDIYNKIQRPIFWCNQIGGQDDIVTGGYSMALLPANDGPVFQVAALFETDVLISDLGQPLNVYKSFEPNIWGKKVASEDINIYYLYKAICLGLRDYAFRCGFQTAVFGSSGGIDSAVVGAIATDVFGPSFVHSVGLPSPYSSEGSISDALALAKNLGITFEVHNISNIYREMKNLFLSGGKQKLENPVADENLQPRIRGTILMAYSNEYGSILLSTGNKSELSVGYCTIHGDMCGGYGVISDLWKTQVYALARFINKYRGKVIPQSIFCRIKI
jgi:NAD+ synthase (glutamine-hydrolysing)